MMHQHNDRPKFTVWHWPGIRSCHCWSAVDGKQLYNEVMPVLELERQLYTNEDFHTLLSFGFFLGSGSLD